MKNRYKDILRENNQKILDCLPGGIKLRNILALEIKKILKENSNVLELGCGEGDSTLYLLKNIPTLKLDCLDVSEEMINISKKILKDYEKNINYICEDGLDYFKKTNKKYDIVTLSWTLHNFEWTSKIKLLQAIFNNLNPNGKLIIMDKIYIGDKEKDKKLLDFQKKRHEELEKNLCEEINNHEEQDFLDNYRMDEINTFKELKKIGFSYIKIIKRIERDIVLFAEKYS